MQKLTTFLVPVESKEGFLHRPVPSSAFMGRRKESIPELEKLLKLYLTTVKSFLKIVNRGCAFK